MLEKLWHCTVLAHPFQREAHPAKSTLSQNEWLAIFALQLDVFQRDSQASNLSKALHGGCNVVFLGPCEDFFGSVPDIYHRFATCTPPSLNEYPEDHKYLPKDTFGGVLH